MRKLEMTRSLAEVKAGFSLEMREQIDIRTAQIMAEIEGLKPMRVALDQTQDSLAKRLNVSQASVAKMEQRTDLLLSTLRQYVEALGGHLSLVVGFPNTPEVRISGLGDIPTSREVARAPVRTRQLGPGVKSQAGKRPRQRSSSRRADLAHAGD